MGSTTRPTIKTNNNALLECQSQIKGKPTQATVATVASTAETTTPVVNRFSDDYVPSEEYQQGLQGFVDQEAATYRSTKHLGTLAELGSAGEYYDSELAKVEQNYVNFWINNFNNKSQSLRDVIFSTHEHSLRTGNTNNHMIALRNILRGVNLLDPSIQGKTIAEVNSDGQLTGNKISLVDFANRAINDEAFLARHIDSQGLDSALTLAARAYLNDDSFKARATYNREYSGFGDRAASIAGGTAIAAATAYGAGAVISGVGMAYGAGAAVLAAEGASIGLFAGGIGAAVTTGSAAAAGTTVAAGTAGFTLAGGASGIIGGVVGGLVAAGPIGWAILGVGALIGAAVIGRGIWDAGKYMLSGRNDQPTISKDGLGAWIGYGLNNILQGCGVFPSNNA